MGDGDGTELSRTGVSASLTNSFQQSEMRKGSIINNLGTNAPTFGQAATS